MKAGAVAAACGGTRVAWSPCCCGDHVLTLAAAERRHGHAKDSVTMPPIRERNPPAVPEATERFKCIRKRGSEDPPLLFSRSSATSAVAVLFALVEHPLGGLDHVVHAQVGHRQHFFRLPGRLGNALQHQAFDPHAQVAGGRSRGDFVVHAADVVVFDHQDLAASIVADLHDLVRLHRQAVHVDQAGRQARALLQFLQGALATWTM